MLIFGFYIAQNNKNPHVTLFKHCISKTARYSILTPLVKKSYLGDKLLNPEYQVIASRPFIYQQIQCAGRGCRRQAPTARQGVHPDLTIVVLSFYTLTILL